MKLLQLLLFSTGALISTSSKAQLELHFDPNVPVTRQGTLLDLAWAGGLNCSQVSEIDINCDGLKDLFIFDHSYVSGHKPVILLKTNTAGVAGYRVSRDYDNAYPLATMHDWALLRDFNCDGLEDIFTYSQAGFSVFKNVGHADCATFEQASYRVNSTYVSPSGAGTNANLFISQVDLPSISDIDGDGDLDILTFSLLGSYLEYHKNLSMETYGTCDSLKYEVRNKCWGYFAENFNNNSVTLNVPCQFNVPNPELGLNDDTELATEARAHAGSTTTALDLNGDGDQDLLLGDISFSNVVGLYNGGSVNSAFMTVEDTLFPSYDVSANVTLFPANFYVDVDRDGRRDLLVSPNATSLIHNYEGLWYYHNDGTDAAPDFTFQQTNLFQDRMIELGEGAMPVAFDENGDGLMDLLVANHGYYSPGGNYIGKVALLRNTGTANAPAFDLITDDYANLSTSGIGSSMFPALTDLDNDGDLDMYIGDLQGRIHFFRNVTTGPVAQFQLEQANISDMDGVMIDVGQFATPHFTDLDLDGKIDLVIGERNGNVNYYRNTGTVTTPQWTLVTENLGGVSTIEYWNVTGHSVPVIFRNEQNDREMLLGSESGWIYHYGDIEGNMDGTWTLLDSAFMDIHDGARTGLCLYDFTNDGELDMVIGNFRGGVSFWRSDLLSTVVTVNALSPGFSLYPNPASNSVELLVDAGASTVRNWVLFNTLGAEVLRGPLRTQRTTLDLSALNEGIYTVRLQGEHASSARRLVVVR